MERTLSCIAAQRIAAQRTAGQMPKGEICSPSLGCMLCMRLSARKGRLSHFI